MSFLTRPVFEFEINWKNPVSKSFAFDLDELAIGFGAEVFTSLQTHVAQGYKFAVELQTPAQIDAFDAFTAALRGRLAGFWLPVPFAAVKWKAAVDATHFDIEDQNLRDTWQDHPDIYLLIGRTSYTSPQYQIAKITNVATAGAGAERITLDTALDPQPNARTPIARLHYVRLVDDTEEGQFVKEGFMTRSLKVVELPLEYTAYETGELPIYLYHFFTNAPATYHWRYTSFAADVASGNELFSKFAINHGSLAESAKLENQSLKITAVKDANHPFSLFFPIPFSRRLNVEVIEVSYADLETQTRRFTGTVRNVAEEGSKLTATCDSWANVLSRKVPLMLIQPTCNYNIYDLPTCKLPRAQKETTAQITAIDNAANPPTVTARLLFASSAHLAEWTAENWFAAGWLETGSALNFEVRTILSSALVDGETDIIQLTLNTFLVHAAVGNFIQLLPGCDGTAETCKTKFNNFVNFGGFVAVPTRNLALKGVNVSVAQGGKK